MAIWTTNKTLGSATSSMKADVCFGGASWPLFGRMVSFMKERMKRMISLIDLSSERFPTRMGE